MMRELLTISGLARQTGVSSKALRYWESLGLLPKAVRTHTGYRVFGRESLDYVRFIQKSKTLGLTLAEMSKLLDLARRGGNPCPEVMRWTERRLTVLEEQIRALSALHRRLKRRYQKWSRRSPCPPDRCAEICYLIADLPLTQSHNGGACNAQTMVGSTLSGCGSAG